MRAKGREQKSLPQRVNHPRKHSFSGGPGGRCLRSRRMRRSKRTSLTTEAQSNTSLNGKLPKNPYPTPKTCGFRGPRVKHPKNLRFSGAPCQTPQKPAVCGAPRHPEWSEAESNRSEAKVPKAGSTGPFLPPQGDPDASHRPAGLCPLGSTTGINALRSG